MENSGSARFGARSRRYRPLALLAAALLLHGCGDSSSAVNSSGGANSDYLPNAPSGGATGTPVTDSQGCTQYGAPPRPLAPGSPDGLLNEALTALINVCTLNNGVMLDDYTDNSGASRRACMIAPSNASATTRLPLMIWFHPTLIGEDAILATNFLTLLHTANLEGSGSAGFILLLPLGRNIQQFLPAPLNTGVGWDHWYRNTDRSSPYINADFETVDHYTAEVEQRAIVDTSRVYVSGWSEGADFGTLYGLNTPGVAVTGVYSTISPFDDPSDPCPAQPFASNNTRPYYLMVRQCDVAGACQLSQTFISQLANGVMPSSLLNRVILNGLTQEVQACDPSCGPGSSESGSLGQTEHLQWPTAWNDTLLQFMEQNPQ
jgi:hypothetical protein